MAPEMAAAAETREVEDLRDPDRLLLVPLSLAWDEVKPAETWTVVDVGTGVGFAAVPFAKAYPLAKVYAFDVAETRIELLRKEAPANLEARIMRDPHRINLPDGCADLVLMVQIQNELQGDAVELFRECRRILKPFTGVLGIIDWKDEDNAFSPKKRVPETAVRAGLCEAGFFEDREEEHFLVQRHDIFKFHFFLTAHSAPEEIEL